MEWLYDTIWVANYFLSVLVLPQIQENRARRNRKFWYGRSRVLVVRRNIRRVPSRKLYSDRNCKFPADCKPAVFANRLFEIINIRTLTMMEADIMWDSGMALHVALHVNLQGRPKIRKP